MYKVKTIEVDKSMQRDVLMKTGIFNNKKKKDDEIPNISKFNMTPNYALSA